MLKSLFRWFGKKPEAVSLEASSENSRQTPDDLTKLYPLILPLSFIDAKWPGPIIPLGDLPFSVSWAVVDPANCFNYIRWDTSHSWEGRGIAWRNVAMENLTRLAKTKLQAGHWKDADERFYMLSLLFDAAMGPSRLLVPGLFSELFGEDYTVAIPERTCAVVHRNNLDDEQAKVANGVIDGCFEVGTEPMSNERFDPRRFWVL